MTLRIERLEMAPLHVNTYVVADAVTRDALIIDPGADVERIAAVIAKHGLRPQAIVATHGHIDHVAGAAEARSRFAVPFLVHAADRDWVADLDLQSRQVGLGHYATPAVDRWLAANDELAVGSHRFRVGHTPGHSAGSCSLVFEADRTVFTGDTLFYAGVGRSDFRGGSPTQLMSSIRSHLVPLGDDVVIHPGHGPSSTLGEERLRLGM